MKLFYSPSSPTQGFTLPVILIISLGLLVIGLSLVQTSASVRSSLDFEYQQRLNAEAAEAGTVYANYCLTQNGLLQTWGPARSRPNLSHRTDCNGTTLSYTPQYLMENGTFKTSFSVGDLDPDSSVGSVLIPSSGSFQQNSGSSSAIVRSSTKNLRQVIISNELKASISASGTAKTCAIVTNELYCWGKNSVSGGDDFTGQLGNGTGGPGWDTTTPVKVRQDPGVLLGKIVDDVFSAQYHSCAMAVGKAYCWGQNDNGQLGNGTTTDSNVPVEVGGALTGKTVTAIGGTGNTSCAIADTKIYCWGRNSDGQVGNNSTTNVNTPTLVSNTNLGGSYIATALSTSGSRSYNMCAIADDKAWCWGRNEAGQIGNATSGSTDVLVPTAVRANSGDALYNKVVTAISQDGYYNGSGGYPHVCVVAKSPTLNDGAAYCWGENADGQLGRNNTTDSNVPVAVSTSGVLSGKVVQDVVAGLRHSCALANAKVYCWGENSAGQVGDGTTSQRNVPVATRANNGDLLYNKVVTAIGGGANRSCAVADFKTYCWGLNDMGQLGDGTTTNKNVPTKSSFLDPKAPAFVF